MSKIVKVSVEARARLLSRSSSSMSETTSLRSATSFESASNSSGAFLMPLINFAVELAASRRVQMPDARPTGSILGRRDVSRR